MATFPEIGLMAVLDTTGFERGAQIIRDSLSGTNKELDKTEESSAGAGGALDTLGGVASGVATGGLTILLGSITAVAAGLIGLSTVGLKWATEFGGAMKLVQAQTGATDEELAALRENVETVYTTGLGESFGDVAETMATVQSMTGTAGEELEALTSDALIMAEVFDIDVSESVRAADGAMVAFGTEGSKIFDLMTRTMQETGDPMDDLADTINEYSTNFADVGFSADEMFNVLTSGLEAGAWNFDVVADSVREFFIRLGDGSDTTAEALGALGIPVQDFLDGLASGAITGPEAMSKVIEALKGIEDPIARNQAGVDLFGTKWEDMGASVVLAMDPAIDKLGEVEGATQEAGKTVHSGLGAAWEELKRTLQVSVAGGFEPVLTMIVEKITPAFQYFADWLKGDGRAVLERFGKLLTDNLGPALANLGPFIEKKVIPMLEKFSDWMIKEGFPAVQKFITWLIKKGIPGFKKFMDFIIKKVIPALDKLIHPFRPIREAIEETIKTFESIVETLGDVIQAAKDWARDFLREIGTTLAETVKAVIDWGRDLLRELGTILGDAVQAVIDWGRDLLRELGTILSDWISDLIDWGREFLMELGTILSDAVQAVIDWGRDLLRELGTILSGWISDLIEWGREFIRELGTILGNAVQAVIDWGTELLRELGTILSGWISDIITWGGQFISELGTILGNAIQAVIDWGVTLLGELGTILSNWVSNLITWGGEFISELGSILGNAVQAVIDWGVQFLSEFGSVLANIISAVVTWGVELYNTMREQLLALANIPSEIMATLTQIGADIVAFIIQGIQGVTTFVSDVIEQLRTWFTDIGNSIVSSFAEGVAVGTELVSRILMGITSWVQDGLGFAGKVVDWLKKQFNNIVKDVVEGVSGLWSEAGEVGKKLIDKIIAGIETKVGDLWRAIAKTLNDALEAIGLPRVFPESGASAGGKGSSVMKTANWVGQSLAAGIAQGIYDGSHWVAQAAVWTVHNALAAAQAAAGVRSPSALFANLGHDLMTGLQAGIAAEIPTISAQIQAAVTAPALVSAPVLGAGGNTSIVQNFNVGGNTIMSNIDEAIFEQRVLDTIRRNLSI